MPSSSSRQHRHHSHSHPNIPMTYSDLSKSDLDLLIPFFAHNTSSSASPDPVSLPSHLRAKLPFLSPFCSMHKKMNPLPIVDILNVIKHEVGSGRVAKYPGGASSSSADVQQLEDVNALWMEAGEFWRVFGRRAPKEFPSLSSGKGKCAACVLVLIGQRVDALIALGGTLIAAIEARHWKRSKRIMWFERWVRASSSGGGEDGVRRMWECGERMRAVKAEGERAHVDEYVARAQRMDLGVDVPVRPEREPEQEDHVSVAEAVEQMGYDELEENPFAEQEEELGARRRVPVASSVYSRPRTEICRDSALLEEQILDLYFHEGLEQAPRGFF